MSENRASDIPLVKDQPSQFATGSYRHPIARVDNWQPVPMLRPETGSALPVPTSYFQDFVPTVSWQCPCPLCLTSAQDFMVALRNTGRLCSANIATTGPLYSCLVASVMQAANSEASATNRESEQTVSVTGSAAAPGGTSIDNGGAAGVGDTLTITVDQGNDVNGNCIPSGLMGGNSYPGSPSCVYYYPSMYYPQNPYMNNMGMPVPSPYFNGNYYWNPSMASAGNSVDVDTTDQNSFLPCGADSGVSDTMNMNVNNDQGPNDNGNHEDNATAEATSDVLGNDLKPETKGIEQYNGKDNSDSKIFV